MKEKTKMKLQRVWISFKQSVYEYAPSIAIGSGLGMLIGGYFGTIANSHQIGKMNKRLDTHEKVINHNADVVQQHASVGNAMIARTNKMQEEIEELQRQNNLLMEKALRETKGD
jgi:TolA-binding protein